MYCRVRFGSKYVMSLHGTDAIRIKHGRAMRFLLRFPDVVVTVGESMRADLEGVKTKAPIECIGNGVDTAQFVNEKYRRKKQIIQVGSFRWQKGKQYLIEAFAKFHARHSDYRLVLVGDGPLRAEMEKLASQLGIRDSVDFLGVQDRQAIAEHLNHSIAFVLSSVSEGFPKVIYEAMATGTPVIATRVAGVESVIKDSGI